MNQQLLLLGIDEESQRTVIEVFGENFFNEIGLDITWIVQNIEIFKKYQIDFYNDIFERYPEIFLLSPKILENKLRKMIHDLGIEYLEKIEEDLSILETLLS